MGRRIKIVCAGLFVILGVALALVFRPSAVPFRFLQGAEPFAVAPLSVFEQKWFHVDQKTYLSRSDWSSLLGRAENELLPEGWFEFKSSNEAQFSKGDFEVVLTRDHKPMTYRTFSSVILYGEPMIGVVGISCVELNHTPSLLERLRSWISGS